MKRLLFLTVMWVLFVPDCTAATSPFNLRAEPFDGIYDDATLKYWQPLFEEDLRINYTDYIYPRLTDEEKQRVGNVTIKSELRGERHALFEFYSYPSQSAIYISTFSQRFFGDLTLAYAWLTVKGFHLSTVPQYVGMISRHLPEEFDGRRFPRPLEALGISSNVRDDPAVKDLYQKMNTTAMLFILCHELGHVYYRHPGYSRPPSQLDIEHEEEADSFAIEILRRMRLYPMGVPFLFVAFSRHETRGETQTHPLSGSRIRALAQAIGRATKDFSQVQKNPAAIAVLFQSQAFQLLEVAKVLEDDQIYRFLLNNSWMTIPKMLKPRKGDNYVIEASPNEKFPALPFSGVYDLTFTSSGAPDEMDGRLILRRDGELVKGEYTYAAAYGVLEGSIIRNELSFKWQEGPFQGKGVLKTTESGKGFVGTWGNLTSTNNGGRWEGHR